MLRRVIDFGLDNRLLAGLLWLLLVALGLYSLGRLPIDAVPDVTNLQVQVMTNSPGLAPEEVEALITYPVEAAMGSLPKLEELRSVSKFGLSVVTVVFEEGTDIYWARQLVGERLSQAKEAIPAGYGEPEIGPLTTGLGEVFQFEITGGGLSPMEHRELLDWVVAPKLRQVPGVAEVNSAGGEFKTFAVTLDPARLKAHGLSLGAVEAALGANNQSVGGGYLVKADEQVLIRGVGRLASLEEIAAVVVALGPDGTPLLVRDLGRVELAPQIRLGAVTRDGRGEAVIGIVMMLQGANASLVTAGVREQLALLGPSLPPGVRLLPFYDRTELVDVTIRTVVKNLAEGGLLVVLVLLLLLGHLRAGLIVAVSIPLSMLVAFTAMQRLGLSANLMSLGALDFGLIVDGSVVMVENIVRRLGQAPGIGGRERRELVRQAALEVARPVGFAVLIIAIVYLPILALTGVEGKLFKPMALTVVFALLGSLLVALTLMPLLADLFLGRVSAHTPWLVRLAERIYRPLLDRAIGRPLLLGALFALAFGGSLLVARRMGAEFIPRLDEGSLAIQVWRLPSVSLEASNQISSRVEAAVLEFPEITGMLSRTGTAEIATDPMGVEISDTFLSLAPRKTWRFKSKEALVAALSKHLEQRFPGVLFSFTQPIELRVSELLSGVRSDLGVHLYAGSGSLEEMQRRGQELAQILAEVPGLEEVKAEQVLGLPTLTVLPDRNSLARRGLDASDVLGLVEALGGKQIGLVLEGQRRFPLLLRLDPALRNDLASLSQLPVSGGANRQSGQPSVPLAEVASLKITDGPAQISRDNIQRRITVEANVRGRDLASTVAAAQARVSAEFDLPVGWFITWGGQFENLSRASQRLTLLVPLVLAVVLVLLVSSFGSARLSLLIFLNVPLAVTGGILALYLRGYPLSISAAVGFIALCGIAVLNGVVLISSAEQHRLSGATPDQAAHLAALDRLRPVLMTALVAALGFLPMALATTAGAEVQRPLATVVIGGLLTSTPLTLLLLPALYRLGRRAALRTEPVGSPSV
jgi:cobalt-zinc-cadmium resistance protein CzcA